MTHPITPRSSTLTTALLLLTIAGPATAGGPQGGDSGVDTGSVYGLDGELCVPGDIVGATWVPTPVVCPYGPETAVLETCATIAVQAVLNGVGFGGVQQAIDAASPGDTVYVCPGTYRELWTWADLTLAAADPTPEATVLLGETSYPYREEWHTAARTTVRGFTFRGGRGVQLSESGVFECVSGREAQRVVYGAGLPRPDVVVRHSTFVGATDASINQPGTLLVEDCAFTDGRNPRADDPTTIHTGYQATAMTIRRTSFVNNWSTQHSGAVLIIGPRDEGTLLIEDCWFERNGSDRRSLDALISGSQAVTPLIVRNTTFVDNEAEDTAVIFNAAPHLDLSDCTFLRNGSGVRPWFASGHNGLWDNPELVELTRSVLLGNWTGTAWASVSQAQSLVGNDIVVRRSRGGDAAFYLEAGESMSCSCCDLGSGISDNDPADVNLLADAPLNFVLP